jgi:hypothetical protein
VAALVDSTAIERTTKTEFGRPNSSQKPTRPGAGPAAELPSQHTSVGGVTAAPQLLGGNRRAASASARGPWPCSLGSSR